MANPKKLTGTVFGVDEITLDVLGKLQRLTEYDEWKTFVLFLASKQIGLGREALTCRSPDRAQTRDQLSGCGEMLDLLIHDFATELAEEIRAISNTDKETKQGG